MPKAEETRNSGTGLKTSQLTTRDQFLQASTLYRLAFGYSAPEHTLNPYLLSAITHNGGAVIGVQTETGELVGAAYGFPGKSEGREYLYSQIAVVHPEQQGKGIGKLLKLAQRDNALQQGFTEMRWVFDPFLSRNAHFNLRGLGAEAIALLPDFYATEASDRILISWDLTKPAAKEQAPAQESTAESTTAESITAAGTASTQLTQLAFTEKDWGVLQETETGTWLPLPRDTQAAQQPELRSRVLSALRSCFESGKRLHDCIRVTHSTAAYQVVQGGTAANQRGTKGEQ